MTIDLRCLLLPSELSVTAPHRKRKLLTLLMKWLWTKENSTTETFNGVGVLTCFSFSPGFHDILFDVVVVSTASNIIKYEWMETRDKCRCFHTGHRVTERSDESEKYMNQSITYGGLVSALLGSSYYVFLEIAMDTVDRVHLSPIIIWIQEIRLCFLYNHCCTYAWLMRLNVNTVTSFVTQLVGLLPV